MLCFTWYVKLFWLLCFEFPKQLTFSFLEIRQIQNSSGILGNFTYFKGRSNYVTPRALSSGISVGSTATALQIPESPLRWHPKKPDLLKKRRPSRIDYVWCIGGTSIEISKQYCRIKCGELCAVHCLPDATISPICALQWQGLHASSYPEEFHAQVQSPLSSVVDYATGFLSTEHRGWGLICG